MCNDHIAISHLWMGEGRGGERKGEEEEGGGGIRGGGGGGGGGAFDEEHHMAYMQCGSAQRGWFVSRFQYFSSLCTFQLWIQKLLSIHPATALP